MEPRKKYIIINQVDCLDFIEESDELKISDFTYIFVDLSEEDSNYIKTGDWDAWRPYFVDKDSETWHSYETAEFILDGNPGDYFICVKGIYTGLRDLTSELDFGQVRYNQITTADKVSILKETLNLTFYQEDWIYATQHLHECLIKFKHPKYTEYPKVETVISKIITDPTIGVSILDRFINTDYGRYALDYETKHFPDHEDFEHVGVGLGILSEVYYFDLTAFTTEGLSLFMNKFKQFLDAKAHQTAVFNVRFEAMATYRLFNIDYPFRDMQTYPILDGHNAVRGTLKFNAIRYLNVPNWTDALKDITELLSEICYYPKDLIYPYLVKGEYPDYSKIEFEEEEHEDILSEYISLLYQNPHKDELIQRLGKFYGHPIATCPVKITAEYCIKDVWYTLLLDYKNYNRYSDKTFDAYNDNLYLQHFLDKFGVNRDQKSFLEVEELTWKLKVFGGYFCTKYWLTTENYVISKEIHNDVHDYSIGVKDTLLYDLVTKLGYCVDIFDMEGLVRFNEVLGEPLDLTTLTDGMLAEYWNIISNMKGEEALYWRLIKNEYHLGLITNNNFESYNINSLPIQFLYELGGESYEPLELCDLFRSIINFNSHQVNDTVGRVIFEHSPELYVTFLCFYNRVLLLDEYDMEVDFNKVIFDEDYRKKVYDILVDNDVVDEIPSVSLKDDFIKTFALSNETMYATDNDELQDQVLEYFSDLVIEDESKYPFSHRAKVIKFLNWFVVYRVAEKITSTYLYSILNENATDVIYDKNSVPLKVPYSTPNTRIYPWWRVCGVLTKRWGSGFHTIYGGKSSIKDVLKPSDKNIYVYFDISAAEVRVAAYLSGETELITLFDNDLDPYIYTAAKLKNKPEAEVTKQERNDMKPVYLGAIYGRGYKSIAKNMGLFPDTQPMEDFRILYNKFKSSFPKLMKFIKRKQDYSSDNEGLIETQLGDVIQGDENRSYTQGINVPIQNYQSVILASGIRQLNQFTPFHTNLVVHDSCTSEYPIDHINDIYNHCEKYIVDFIYNTYGVKYKFEIKLGVSYNRMIEAEYQDDGTIKLKGQIYDINCLLDRIRSIKNIEIIKDFTKKSDVITDPMKSLLRTHHLNLNFDKVLDSITIKLT